MGYEYSSHFLNSMSQQFSEEKWDKMSVDVPVGTVRRDLALDELSGRGHSCDHHQPGTAVEIGADCGRGVMCGTLTQQCFIGE